MFKDQREPAGPTGDETIPARRAVPERTRSQPHTPPAGLDLPPSRPPALIQQFLNGEADLDVELARRFPSPPLLSSVHTRGGERFGTATLTTQDGACAVLIEVDRASHAAQMVFSFGSMLALRFSLDTLSDVDRSHWLDHVRRQAGGVAFLWGQARWESDYVISSAHRYFTTLYAFSPRGVEAAARTTPDTLRRTLDWLAPLWTSAASIQPPPDNLTTW